MKFLNSTIITLGLIGLIPLCSNILAEQSTPTLPDYQQLLKDCPSECCRASVRAMQSAKSQPLKYNDSCPDGRAPTMLRCIDSYRWCEVASAPGSAQTGPTMTLEEAKEKLHVDHHNKLSLQNLFGK